MAVPPVLVVGVDRSRSSERALRFAVAEAGRRWASLRVVNVDETTAHRSSSRRETEQMIGRVCAGQSVPPPIEVLVKFGSAEEAWFLLIVASRDADLLIAGHRRRSAETTEIVGKSIAEYCVRHAMCPVTVISTSCEAINSGESASYT